MKCESLLIKDCQFLNHRFRYQSSRSLEAAAVEYNNGLFSYSLIQQKAESCARWRITKQHHQHHPQQWYCIHILVRPLHAIHATVDFYLGGNLRSNIDTGIEFRGKGRTRSSGLKILQKPVIRLENLSGCFSLCSDTQTPFVFN